MHSRANIEEMVKYQNLLQNEFTKNQATIDRQARNISKLEKDIQRETRIKQNTIEENDNLRKKLEQRLKNFNSQKFCNFNTGKIR